MLFLYSKMVALIEFESKGQLRSISKLFSHGLIDLIFFHISFFIIYSMHIYKIQNIKIF